MKWRQTQQSVLGCCISQSPLIYQQIKKQNRAEQYSPTTLAIIQITFTSVLFKEYSIINHLHSVKSVQTTENLNKQTYLNRFSYKQTTFPYKSGQDSTKCDRELITMKLSAPVNKKGRVFGTKHKTAARVTISKP